ncbi:MAG: hypothetical protein HLUCCA11_15850 [Phormidesmis priestleyi Ana]|uniref:DUF5357 domain-containing protein n=1 Tax=Phormidesmis priestleyi Ana TaxID=1666911 RepID=A0A0P8BZ60_9CYAN|nr:MAG: hypothetical protein HLUCCA11_15850 [Phormidesmis priestleyi Ana]
MQDAFKDFTNQMRSLLWPEKYFAWQTLLMLSLFSWLVAILLSNIEDGNPIAVEVLSTLSWMFLTSAIWWALEKNKIKVYGFSIGPWITGAVFCLFAFRPWEDGRFRWALSCWPLISVAIMALPDFVNWELKVSLPAKDKRQPLIMVLLVNLLLTSWILFYFRVQDWLRNYPSLLINDLNRSAFVYDFEPNRQPIVQGIPLLESTASAIADELSGQPWYQAERWLYTRKNRLEDIALRMNNNLAAPDEQIFWQIAVPEPQRLGSGYLLTLRADWIGPVAGNQSFYIEKSCKITPEDRARTVPNTPASGEANATATNPAQSSTTPSSTTPSSTNRQNAAAQVSRVAVVDCGEDEATVQWTGEPE